MRARSACAALTRRAHSARSICGRQRLRSSSAGAAFGDQPVAPGLDALEALGLLGIHLAARIERGTDRLRVDIAHQLADVLALPGPGGAAVDGAQGADRLLEFLGQVKRLQLRIAQLRQLHAQVLRGVRGALARALAGALRRLVLLSSSSGAWLT